MEIFPRITKKYIYIYTRNLLRFWHAIVRIHARVYEIPWAVYYHLEEGNSNEGERFILDSTVNTRKYTHHDTLKDDQKRGGEQYPFDRRPFCVRSTRNSRGGPKVGHRQVRVRVANQSWTTSLTTLGRTRVT